MPDLYSASTAKNKNSTIKSSGATMPLIRDFIPPAQGHSLSSFIVLPNKNIRFETQEPEEEILLILRAHWATNLSWFLVALLLFFAPALLKYFPLLTSLPVKFQMVFVIVWYLILLMYVFEKFLSWFFNLTIITDERIVDVDFLNLTTKKVADTEIEKIQDISFTRKGVVETVCNFGDILVQTAAEKTQFVFEKVPNPTQVVTILQRLRTEEKIETLEGRIR